jgi:hypothetical protein
MVAYWVKPSVGNGIEDDGSVHLSNGSEVLLSTISGSVWNKKRLDKLNSSVQAKIDNVVSLSSLDDDDPDKTMRAAELKAIYGNRVFLDGQGNIIYRSALITFIHDGTRLIPRSQRVR